MEIASQDDAKDEAERLLIQPIQIGSTWVCRSKAARAVVVTGLADGKVCVAVIGDLSSFTEYHIVDFHAFFVHCIP